MPCKKFVHAHFLPAFPLNFFFYFFFIVQFCKYPDVWQVGEKSANALHTWATESEETKSEYTTVSFDFCWPIHPSKCCRLYS